MTLNDSGAITDGVTATMSAGRELADHGGIFGEVVAELRGPDGELKARSVTRNLITSVGDQYYAGRAALPSSLPAQVTGFKLGTGSTAPAKSGAGAALVTYAAGKATTASAITEVVLVTDTLADATSTAANTISRALLSGIGSKGASDTLTVTWTHTLLGA